MKRPFKGLRDRPPHASYDAVVIGAGIGGLFCANLLAREGLSVLLLEQHYMAGGYCSTFKRKGYTFDAASHFYPLLGNPDTLTGRLLSDLGVETGWVKMDPVDTFHFPDGSRFSVPADFDNYRAKLSTAFPAENEALDRFFAAAREAYLAGLLYYFRGQSGSRFERYRDQTLRQVLDRHFTDPKLKLLLTADCPHWGSPPCRTSFVFDSMLRLSYFLGNYYPVGGSQAFADELAYRLEQAGCDILMSTRADRIVVRNGRACGVEIETTRGALRGRRSVNAGVVVSNADLLQTNKRLLDPGLLDPGYTESLERLRPTHPCFLTHIGLEGVEPELLEDIQGYYWTGWDPDEFGRTSLRCKIFAPTLYEPRLAPPGGQIVILQKVLDMDDLPTALWSELDWAQHKASIEEYVCFHLEQVAPGIGRKVVVKTAASAHTAERFTLNHAGAMLGWEMSPEQLGDGRPDNTSTIEGLYLVGHWTRPGGGITPTIVSATHVADKITTGRTPSARATHPLPEAHSTDSAERAEGNEREGDVNHAPGP